MTPEQPPTTEIVPKGRQSMEMLKILTADVSGNYRHLVEEIVRAETERDLFDQDYRTAKVFAMSGQFEGITGQTPEQAIATAMAKIRIGRGWQLNDSDSIAYISFLNGKPSVATDILAQKIQGAGYGWDVQWHEETIQLKKGPHKKCVGCTLWLKAFNRQANRWEPVVDRDDNPVSASFTEGDAEQAIIWENKGQKKLSEKWNYQSWGRDMYFWSAMRRLRKYYLTGIMRGAIQAELADLEVELDQPQQIDAPAPPQPEEPKKKNIRDIVLESDEQQPGLLEEQP
jgi:hypothetical protein